MTRTARLTVTNNHMHGRGWRLFWADVGDDGEMTGVGCYTEGECSAKVHPTMRDAIAYGERMFGERAIRNPWD